MPLTNKHLYRALVDAALDFGRRRPWDRLRTDQCFLLRFPGEPHPWIASVMGEGGEEFGLALHGGEDAPAKFRRLFLENLGPDEGMEDIHYLAFSIGPLREIPLDMRRILDVAGFRGRRETPAPCFLAKDPRQRARLPRRNEAEILLRTLRAIARAEEAGQFDPDGEWLGGGPILVISAEGDLLEPAVAVAREALPDTPRVLPAPARLPDRLASLPRRDVRWLVSFSTAPMAIRGDDRLVKMLLVLEDPTGNLLVAKPVFEPDIQEPVAIMIRAMEGDNAVRSRGLPRTITFASYKLHQTLAPGLSLLGIESEYSSNVPALRAIEADMAEHLSSGAEGDLVEDVAAAFTDLDEEQDA